uniref:General odorant-binding protein 56d n=1 Tax=Culex pipiens TaxID=7175 RepID=A0A8D8A7Q4_CULPI
MKCLVLIVAALAVGTHAFFTPQQVEFAKKLSADCEAEVGDGLPDNIGERFRMGDLTLTDDKSKCYMRCIFGKVNFLDRETGVINKETLALKLAKGSTQEKAERFAVRCGSFEGANACEKAHGLYECYFTKKDEYFA